MRLAYGEGALVAILAPIVIFLFGIIDLDQMFFLIFLLFGAWTLFYSFIFLDQNERMYYLTWGLILACLSSAFIAPIQYAIALIILAIIVMIFINAATRKSKTMTSTQVNMKS